MTNYQKCPVCKYTDWKMAMKNKMGESKTGTEKV